MTDGFSQRTPQQALAALLERFTPQRLLLVGTRFPALDAFAQAHPQVTIATAAPGPLPAELAAQRFDLAVLVDCLEHLPKRTGLELLGGIRNLNASRVAVLADLAACGWQDTDFFALALSASEKFCRDQQVLSLFTYDLHDYKQVPDWLNARFWANPEMFGSTGGKPMNIKGLPNHDLQHCYARAGPSVTSLSPALSPTTSSGPFCLALQALRDLLPEGPSTGLLCP
jgi:DNA-binding transcriptional LysR family regulator